MLLIRSMPQLLSTALRLGRALSRRNSNAHHGHDHAAPYRPYAAPNGILYANSPEEKREEIEHTHEWFEELDHERYYQDRHYKTSKIASFIPYLEKLYVDNPNAVVLDVACGGGYVIGDVLEKYRSFRGFAFDITGLALRFGRHRTPGVFGVADMEDIPLGDGTVDAILCVSALHHFIRFPNRAMSELRRVLRPGGLLLLNEPVHVDGPKELQVAVHQLQQHVEKIIGILAELRGETKYVEVKKQRFQHYLSDVAHTEGSFVVSELLGIITAAGFDLLEWQSINHTGMFAKDYTYGFEIARTVDAVLSQTAPGLSSMVCVVARSAEHGRAR